jgi:hypothetical protein
LCLGTPYSTKVGTAQVPRQRRKRQRGRSRRKGAPTGTPRHSLALSLARSTLRLSSSASCHLTARAVLNSHARLGTVWSVGKSCHFWTRHYPCSDPLYYPCGPSFPVQSSCKEPRNLLLSRRKHLLYSVLRRYFRTPYRRWYLTLPNGNKRGLSGIYLFGICHLPFAALACCCLLLPPAACRTARWGGSTYFVLEVRGRRLVSLQQRREEGANPLTTLSPLSSFGLPL